MSDVHIATFYKFADLADYRDWQHPLRQLCQRHGVRGTILLAAEGINATIAGTETGVEAVLAYLREDPRLREMPSKHSQAVENPFHRLKVRLKAEIVSLGQPAADPTRQVGTYVSPKEWNRLIQDPEVLLIDTRNQYEVGIGSFQNAVDPALERFREFPDYVSQHLDPARHRRVAMFCTGGIRCEKASSYLLARGFDEVYHLEGGILRYLEEVPEQDSLWEGECFVFDERVSVGVGLTPGTHELCRGCRRPISIQDKQHPAYQPGVCCPHCAGREDEPHYTRAAERWRQVQLAEARGEAHLGVRLAPRDDDEPQR